MKMSLPVSILGDGAMATVCAQVLAGKGGAVKVTVWGRDAGRLKAMGETRENVRYLPGVRLEEGIGFEGDEQRAFRGAALIVCAVPTQFIRGALLRVRGQIPVGTPVVSVAKGIELETLKRPSEIIAEVLEPCAVATLSGPSIAGELARKLPATMVTAGQDARGPRLPAHPSGEALARWIQKLFTTPYLRVYRNEDLLGVEFAGAAKNVIAIAAGVLDGMRAGNNAKAALLSRGLVEISRLGVNLGAMAETFTGLAGLGDLVTTCVSPEGRNRSFGERVGRGEKPEEILKSVVGVVEGVPTCRSLVKLARERHVDMPISQGLHAVLFEGRDVRSQLAALMARESKSE